MRLIALFSGLLPLLFLYCASGGIGHEGEAKITGKIAYETSDKNASGLPVYIHASYFTKDTSDTQHAIEPATYTDKNGFFSLTPSTNGSFVIEINDGERFGCCMRAEITADKNIIDLPIDTLRHTGAIRGKLLLQTRNSINVFVQVLGLDRIARCDSRTDSFFINDIPHGNYQLRIITSEPAMSPKKIDSITVVTGGITSISFSYENSDTTPPHSKCIKFNTTSSGAAIKSDLLHFPVLIRLYESNFDFSTAQADGSDLLFLDSKEQSLPFEIERWDANLKQAELWVTVDTLHGNDSTQSVFLQWGATASGYHTNSTTAFDTAAGFQGIWHLAEHPGDTARDATVNNFFGIAYGMNSASPVSGIIGLCQKFDGSSSYISMPTTTNSKLNFPENGYFSLSAWVYIDTFLSNYQSFISKSNQLYGLGINDQNTIEFFEFENTDSWKTNSGQAEAGTWVLITGISDGEQQYLYFNDTCIDSIPEPIGGKKYRVTTDPVTIGRRTSSSIEGWFNGRIDEARIYSVALTSDWIKCSYFNQRQDDKLTKVLP